MFMFLFSYHAHLCNIILFIITYSKQSKFTWSCLNVQSNGNFLYETHIIGQYCLFFREPQDMEGESDIEITSDSESESEWHPGSSTGSDSLSENDSAEAKQGKKRKLKKRKCNQKGPSSLCTPNKRQAEGTKVSKWAFQSRVHFSNYITKQLDEF